MAQASIYESWTKLVEVSFRHHYNVPQARLDNLSLPFSTFSRYQALMEMLEQDLRTLIEIRNKLAHGQWIYPFINEGTAIEPDKLNVLRNENLQAIQFKQKMIGILCDIVHDLVVSPPTFERDFDRNYRLIEQIRLNLRNRRYEEYRDNLIKKKERGIQKRKESRLKAVESE